MFYSLTVLFLVLSLCDVSSFAWAQTTPAAAEEPAADTSAVVTNSVKKTSLENASQTGAQVAVSPLAQKQEMAVSADKPAAQEPVATATGSAPTVPATTSVPVVKADEDGKVVESAPDAKMAVPAVAPENPAASPVPAKVDNAVAVTPVAEKKEPAAPPAKTTVSVSPSPAAGEEESVVGKKIVKAIEVKGNKTVNLTTILFKIKTRVGQEYLQSVISDDLKRLYNTGYFSDVNVDRVNYEGGFKVIFYVTEKALIDNITFSKLRYQNPRALEKKIQSKKGKFLDRKTLNDDVRMIKDLYAKKGLIQAEVDVETKADDLTNKVSLHFVIKEGQRVRVRRILVEGNKTFPAKKIIKVIKTRNKWLFNSGYYKQDVIDEDMERIKSFYEHEGFIDAKAEYEFEPTKNGYGNVRLRIVEGKRYYVQKISFVGNKVIDTPALLAAMKEIKEGKVFSRERLSVDISNIRVLYFDKGYIFANVKESTSLAPDTGKVEVKLDVSEGELAYVDQIKVQGNDRTRDIVIRRELRLFPGDRFDGEKLRRSKQRLTNLGYFEDINYDIEDTDLPNRKNLLVQVKEAKTGSFSFGGGYSTIDQFVGFVELEQKNFDFTNWPTFTGGGQDISLRTETGSTRNNTRLSFTEPWLFDYPISAGFDAYRNEHKREQDVGYAYNETRTGGDLRLGKQFTEYLSGGLTYRREEIKIGNFADNVSADLLAEEGRNTLSSMSFNLAHDKRDNVFNPTRGTYLNQTVDVAGGILGGTQDFWRVSEKASYYVPLTFDSVVEFSVRAGIVQAYGDSERVPIFERFYAGGARTIRGYNERKVGPLDSGTNDPIGGESLLVGNVEYLFPLLDFLKWAAFYDIGNVWPKVGDFASGGLKAGTGLGFRVKTPIGPVNLDYGYPLNSEPGESKRSGKFYFSISRGF